MFIIPGVLLSAMWLFPGHLMVDRHMGVIEALRTSWRIVIARGFWMNFAAALLISVMFAASLIPYIGPLAGWLLAPLAWLINTSAYIQEVKEHSDLSEFAPRGFPVVPMAGMATPAT